MISIIIPAYNGAKFLKNISLPSLGRQTFQDYEAIVIDDGSRDETEKIIREFAAKNQRIKYLKHDSNRGLAAALNSGFHAATGEIICFLEQDDAWLKNKLNEQNALMDVDTDLVVAKFFTFNPRTKKITGQGAGNFSTLMFRKNFLARFFPLPEDKKFLGIEDGILAARLALAETADTLKTAVSSVMADISKTTIIKSAVDAQATTTKKDFQKTQVTPAPLVLFARHPSSLSGAHRPEAMIKKYRAALTEFQNEKSPALKKLKHFWRTHLFYNRLMSIWPRSTQKIIYAVAATINYGRSRLTTRHLKKISGYAEAQMIIENINLD